MLFFSDSMFIKILSHTLVPKSHDYYFTKHLGLGQDLDLCRVMNKSMSKSGVLILFSNWIDFLWRTVCGLNSKKITCTPRQYQLYIFLPKFLSEYIPNLHAPARCRPAGNLNAVLWLSRQVLSKMWSCVRNTRSNVPVAVSSYSTIIISERVMLRKCSNYFRF